MNLNFLCCIGAELKNSTQQTTRMTQVYLYRAFETETVDDMLSPGFFNAAMGIIRKDDLLLLYSPNETVAKWTYARVSNVDRDGVTVERISFEAESISVNTTGYSNISGNNLQEIIDSIDSEFSKYVKLDGTSIMTGPLKMRAGSMQGAIAAYWDGVGFFKLNSNDSVTLLASMEATDGLCPATNNTYNLGKTNYKWKDAHIARVITAIINNGYDIAVPVTNGPDTLALKSEVDTAANSGRMITDQGVWFAKMYAGTTPPAADDGTNYADFSQTDGDGNPIIVIYERQSGAWVQSQTVTPPANYDGYVSVTKKIWDIVEQTGQNGGRILWNHQSKEFTPFPNIVSFEDIEITGNSTVEMPVNPGVQQITNKNYVDSAIAASSATKANVDMDNLTSTGKNIAKWSSNIVDCFPEIPQDIKLELAGGVLTLKAGSKVYVPNGAGVFDTVITQSDLTITINETSSYFVFVKQDGSGTYTGTPATCFSGATQPSVGVQYAYWYDTANNVIKFTSNTGSTWTALNCSLPIAIVTAANGTINSIDQIFNGFGYIGSTSFALPGVKALIPNGRNADGTLKNIKVVLDTVETFTDSYAIDGTLFLAIKQDKHIGNYFVSNLEYRKSENLYYYNGNKPNNQMAVFSIYTSKNGGKIETFTLKTVFRAVDYNDTEYIGHQAMPSDRRIDLTLGASDSAYTAPADGYFYWNGTFNTNTTGSFRMTISSVIGSSTQLYAPVGRPCRCFLPAKKGTVVTIAYENIYETYDFAFIYAEGSK